ncbi:unnamed protein product [Pleuronectes platessa]|uniref:Uncharacterized protein n=1 Tax=Pleuronectes platessa TaxID=8262 RepID=A0A9N7YN81_PLEPL|nr:unnamed protein product [Pleuronectes platessa]
MLKLNIPLLFLFNSERFVLLSSRSKSFPGFRHPRLRLAESPSPVEPLLVESYIDVITAGRGSAKIQKRLRAAEDVIHGFESPAAAAQVERKSPEHRSNVKNSSKEQAAFQ